MQLDEARLFFAIDLASLQKEALKNLIEKLKKRDKKHEIRWSNPSQLHITLHFLGNFKVVNIEKLITIAKNNLTHFSCFELDFNNVEFFPSKYQPRVISLSLEPHEKLRSLAEALEEPILSCNHAVEKRPYRAHLTLGRVKKSHPVFKIESLNFKIPSMMVENIHLFKSESSKEGPKYTSLHCVPLQKI